MADTENDRLPNLEDLLRDENYEPSRKDLIDLMNSPEIDEETRESLRNLLYGDVPQVFGGYGSGTYLAIAFVVTIFLIILFFGYKLYKSIKDKQKKREEKKKQKELKKKK